MTVSTRTSLPHGRTARRLDWPHLPPTTRELIEKRLGSPVVDAVSQRAGYTPGFASVLTCADGSRHFVKAASAKAQRLIAASYREEARKLRTLPPEVAAPRLLWCHDAGDWVALETQYVEARLPDRPWTEGDLLAASAMLVETAAQLTPAPGMGLATAADEFAAWPSYWEQVQAAYDGVDRAPEAAALAGRYAEVLAGETLCHTDIRDDNLLFTAEGRVYACDWNWPVAGAAWFDSLCLLIGPRGDGLDVEQHINDHPLLGEVPAEDIDTVLALLAGYFLKSAAERVPSNSPHLREVQLWQGEVCWEWLEERRGW